MSERSIDLYWQYVLTRFTARRMLPLLFVVLTASFWASWPTSWFSALIDLLLATALIFQFRLWDDLRDVVIDHPDRVLVRAKSLRPFWILLGAAMLVNFVVVFVHRPWPASAYLATLTVGLACWYGWRSPRGSRIVNYHVVLLKYPIFVLILSRHEPVRPQPMLLLSMSCLFLLLCVGEVVHDASIRRNRRAQGIALAEFALFLFLIFAELNPYLPAIS